MVVSPPSSSFVPILSVPRGGIASLHRFLFDTGSSTLDTLHKLRHNVQVFLRNVYNHVPGLTYHAYIRIVPAEDINTVYVYAFDGDEKLEGGYAVGVDMTTSTVKVTALVTSRFFAFCRASVPVVFGSDDVRAVWYEGVCLECGVRKLVVVGKPKVFR